MEKFIVKNLEDLKDLANLLARRLKGGDVLGLVGDLGSGKTTLTQMLCAELGVEGLVRSPTFVLMNLHEAGESGRTRGILEVCHVDAYRIEDESELIGIGIEEFINNQTTLTVIEWADLAPMLHQSPRYIEVKFNFLADGSREVTIDK